MELIQHKRSWMIKRGIVKGKLSVNSAKQRLTGSCPLMPEEVGDYIDTNSQCQDWSNTYKYYRWLLHDTLETLYFRSLVLRIKLEVCHFTI
jgi:hypothetical protein